MSRSFSISSQECVKQADNNSCLTNKKVHDIIVDFFVTINQASQSTPPVLSSGAMLINVLPTPRARGVPSVSV